MRKRVRRTLISTIVKMLNALGFSTSWVRFGGGVSRLYLPLHAFGRLFVFVLLATIIILKYYVDAFDCVKESAVLDFLRKVIQFFPVGG